MLKFTQPIKRRRVTFWLAIEHGRAIVEINGVKRRQPLLLNSHLKQTRTHVVMRYVCYYVLNSWLIIKTYHRSHHPCSLHVILTLFQIDFAFASLLYYHSSKNRGLCLMKSSSETLQNFPYLNIQSRFSFVLLFVFL